MRKRPWSPEDVDDSDDEPITPRKRRRPASAGADGDGPGARKRHQSQPVGGSSPGDASDPVAISDDDGPPTPMAGPPPFAMRVGIEPYDTVTALYELGLKRGVTKAVAKKAYHTQCRARHPDRYPNATEDQKKQCTLAFQHLGKAWTILSAAYKLDDENEVRRSRRRTR